MREKIGVGDIDAKFGMVSKETFLNDLYYPLCSVFNKDGDAATATLWYNIVKRKDSKLIAKTTERIVETRKTMPTPKAYLDVYDKIAFEEKAGSSGKVLNDKVLYVCRDGRAIAMWKAIESACKKSGCETGWNNWLARCAPAKFENGVLHVLTPSAFFRDRLSNSPTERRLWNRGLPDGVRASFEVFRGEGA